MTETNPAWRDDHWATTVVAALGHTNFHTALLTALYEEVAADHITHVCYANNGEVHYCSSASLLDPSLIEWTTRVFVEQSFYQRDPNYGLLRKLADHPGQHHNTIIKATLPHSIADTEYRRVLYEQPGLVSKISLIGACDDGVSYINLYFSRPHSTYIPDALQHRAPLLVALAQRHWQICCTPPHAEQAVGIAWRQGLSLRETQVADLLLQGHTAKEVARFLNLSPTTVITYKHRLFKKHQVENLKEFLLMAPPTSRGHNTSPRPERNIAHDAHAHAAGVAG